MSSAILSLLDRIERDHRVRIVYACESGSRAWGFASPDSDYDIRFLFVRPESSYVAVAEGTDSIDLPLQDGDLDAGGWDVRKAAGLLAKSNGALLEWLHSPVVYHADPGFRERWQSTARLVFSPRAARDHYHGLARQMRLAKLQEPRVRAKDYLYALRAVLGVRWIGEDRGIPPVDFATVTEVAPEEIRAILPGLLAHKERTTEGERMERIPVLDAFLDRELGHRAQVPAGTPDREAVDALLRAEVRRDSLRMRAADFTLERVRRPDLLLFESVAGSHAYGTAVERSDEDMRGVFVAPRSFLLGLEEVTQVSDERNDRTYYELGHFMALLLKNNPNALELLAMPEDCVRHRHPLFARLKPELFLSKLCSRTFGDYAMGQIRKARGLNKKIVNPEPEQRRAMLDFCHVPEGQGSTPVVEWLAARGLGPRQCGVTAVAHAAGMFALYADPAGEMRGLVSPKDPDTLVFSSVPREAVPMAWMHFNRDAFSAHCKSHREYWEWVGRRNEERYAVNATHGRGYDSKNLMHTLRLLDMAWEIATGGELRVRRPDRDYLLRVRAGEFDYEDLVARAEDRLAAVQDAFSRSPLPDEPDRDTVNELLVEIRLGM